MYEILKSIRSHGWDRDASPEYSTELRNKWKTSDFDSLYTFYHSGFNLRSTDLQAFIGLGQIDKLDYICKRRNENFEIYQKELKYIKPFINSRYDSFISNFAYPIISKNRDSIVATLQNKNIEVRPMICGSMGKQPFYVKEYGKKELPNASIIDEYGFYVPNHPDLNKKDILTITDIINNIDPLVGSYLQTR